MVGIILAILLIKSLNMILFVNVVYHILENESRLLL